MDASTQALLDDFSRLVRELMSHQPVKAGVTPLVPVLDEHLGQQVADLPVVVHTVPAHRWADFDIAIAAIADADPAHQVLGVRGGDQRHHQGLSDLISFAEEWGRFLRGSVDYLNVAIGPDTERATIAFGLHLFTVDGQPIVVGQRAANRQYGTSEGQFEVISAQPEHAAGFIERLNAEALTHSVLRGQVVSFVTNDYESTAGGLTFQPRPRLTADDVVLPDGVLDRVNQHVISMATHHDRLRAYGQHLKRGILLYGPPGTGKTHTVRYLIATASAQTTVILLSGRTLALVGEAARIARAHQPAIVVLEDCDLIAQDRQHDGGGGPMLFELLDAMDGLDADADVVFLLTTNRADLLEQALAQRPGRVDLAVQIGLPDLDSRSRLLRLYARGIAFSQTAIDAAAAATEQTTASFAKELVRRSVLIAALAEREPGDADLEQALADLLADTATLTRALLGVQDG